jgi:hypothetical protein
VDFDRQSKVALGSSWETIASASMGGATRARAGWAGGGRERKLLLSVAPPPKARRKTTQQQQPSMSSSDATAAPPMYTPPREMERDLAISLVRRHLGETPANTARVLCTFGPLTAKRLQEECVGLGGKFDLPAVRLAGAQEALASVRPVEVLEGLIVLKRHGLVHVFERGRRITREDEWNEAVVEQQSMQSEAGRKRAEKKKSKARKDAAEVSKRRKLRDARETEYGFAVPVALRLAFDPMFKLVVARDLGLVEAAVFSHARQVGRADKDALLASPVLRLVDKQDDGEQEKYLSSAEKLAGLRRLVARGVLCFDGPVDKGLHAVTERCVVLVASRRSWTDAAPRPRRRARAGRR